MRKTLFFVGLFTSFIVSIGNADDCSMAPRAPAFQKKNKKLSNYAVKKEKTKVVESFVLNGVGKVSSESSGCETAETSVRIVAPCEVGKKPEVKTWVSRLMRDLELIAKEQKDPNDLSGFQLHKRLSEFSNQLEEEQFDSEMQIKASNEEEHDGFILKLNQVDPKTVRLEGIYYSSP